MSCWYEQTGSDFCPHPHTSKHISLLLFHHLCLVNGETTLFDHLITETITDGQFSSKNAHKKSLMRCINITVYGKRDSGKLCISKVRIETYTSSIVCKPPSFNSNHCSPDIYKATHARPGLISIHCMTKQL